MHLQSLHVYPIKGLAGISLNEARLTRKGILHDRRWMLVDADSRFISQREFAQLALGIISIESDYLRVTAQDRPDLGTLEVPFLPQTEDRLPVTIWDDVVTGVRVSPAADGWFSAWLGMDCRLVYMPDDSHRPLDPRFQVADDDDVSFADGYPFLLIGQASLNYLNDKLAQPVPMNRFRPNLVVANSEPFAEDSWASFQVGGAILQGVKPCARCTVTTIDQQTAHKGQEPLRTLTSFRRSGNKVLFGQNVVLISGEWLRVGDPVVVQSYLSAPVLNK